MACGLPRRARNHRVRKRGRKIVRRVGEQVGSNEGRVLAVAQEGGFEGRMRQGQERVLPSGDLAPEYAFGSHQSCHIHFANGQLHCLHRSSSILNERISSQREQAGMHVANLNRLTARRLWVSCPRVLVIRHNQSVNAGRSREQSIGPLVTSRA